jgi:hypothetical protein
VSDFYALVRSRTGAQLWEGPFRSAEHARAAAELMLPELVKIVQAVPE